MGELLLLNIGKNDGEYVRLWLGRTTDYAAGVETQSDSLILHKSDSPDCLIFPSQRRAKRNVRDEGFQIIECLRCPDYLSHFPSRFLTSSCGIPFPAPISFSAISIFWIKPFHVLGVCAQVGRTTV